MYEFHGWVTIRQAYNEKDEEPDHLNTLYGLLQDYISQLNWNTGLIDLRWVNLYPHLAVSGLNNRKDSYASEIMSLYNYIARIAPGSYGLLYTLDDDVENEFRVFVLTKGKIQEHSDPFLSPFMPVVEDPS